MPRLRVCPQCLALFGAVSRCLADHLRTKREGAVVVIIHRRRTTAGMSGGPVVDRDGRLTGVLVRASDGQSVTSYIRAVSMR